MVRFYCADTETFPIGKDAPYPTPVCAQIAWEDVGTGSISSWIASVKCDRDQLLAFLKGGLEDEHLYWVLQNAQFDWIVLCLEFPEIEPLVWAAYKAGRIVDVSTMHKILALAEWGDIESTPFDDPNRQAAYSQAALTSWYLGKDRTAQKMEGSVRTQYSMVDGIPVAEWPEEFTQYALEDPSDLVTIFNRILQRAQKSIGVNTLIRIAGARARKHFALGWMTYEGMRTDPERVMHIEEEVEEILDLDNYPLLIESGVIRPPQPPRPHAKGAKDHVAGCPAKGKGSKMSCDCPVKMTAGTSESLNRKKLQQTILEVARTQPEHELALTPTGVSKYEQICGDRVKKLPASDELWDKHPEWIAGDKKAYTPLVPFSEVFREYAKRATVIKMRTDYVHRFFWDEGNQIPRAEAQKQLKKTEKAQRDTFIADKVDIQVVDRMRFNFKDLVSTGRVGSFAGELYPSMNGQNPDPRIRPAMGADPGWILYSTDYNALELRAAAWRCMQLGIDSVLLRLFQLGEDPHGYLAGALLRDMGGDDAHLVEGTQGMDCLRAFNALKKSHPKVYKLWRTFSKVEGLGCWGGMGPATTLVQAHAPPYELSHITLEMTTAAREVWRAEFPEQRAVFEHLRTELVDEDFSHYNDEGELQARYKVITPLGMVRRNCLYTVAANGLALQPPSAEGVGEAVFECVRAARDWTQESPAYGARFVDFLHDELIYQLPIREDFTETEAMRAEIETLMCDGVNVILEGVPMAVETAAMYRWDKFAPEAYTEDGWLVPADTPLPLQPA